MPDEGFLYLFMFIFLFIAGGAGFALINFNYSHATVTRYITIDGHEFTSNNTQEGPLYVFLHGGSLCTINWVKSVNLSTGHETLITNQTLINIVNKTGFICP